MKTTINLLPPERKEELKEKKGIAVIMKIGWAAFLSILLFSVFLLFCFWTINIQIDSIREQQRQLAENKKYSQVQEMQKFAENYFKQTSRLDRALQQQNYYWDLFNEINHLVSNNIYLKEVTLQDSAVSITGFSETRGALLKFKNDLEASDKFSKIDAPISNFTSSENIDFSFKAEIK